MAAAFGPTSPLSTGTLYSTSWFSNVVSKRRPRFRCAQASFFPTDGPAELPEPKLSPLSAAAQSVALTRAQFLSKSLVSSDTTAADVEAELRSLGASSAADLAYAALRDAPKAPQTWRAALRELSDAGLQSEVLDRAVDKLGLHRLLALDPEAAHGVRTTLAEEVSIPPGRLRRLLARRPELLENVDALRVTVHFLRENAQLAPRDIETLAARWPDFTEFSPDRGIRVLEELRKLVPSLSMRRILLRAPFVLTFDVDAHVRPSLRWLLIHDIDAKVVLRACPHVLGVSPTVLSEVRDFLCDEVGLTRHQFACVARIFPLLLACNVKLTLRPAIRFLRVELGIERAAVVHIVRAFPSTLTLDVDDEMRVIVEYFRGKGVENICRIVQRLPPILGYELESDIAPKMHYLEHNLGLSPFDLLSFPAYFSYSLHDRIVPRTKFLQSIGRPLLDVGLNRALTLSDEIFCRRVACRDITDYRSFCDHLDTLGTAVGVEKERERNPKRTKKRFAIYEMR